MNPFGLAMLSEMGIFIGAQQEGLFGPFGNKYIPNVGVFGISLFIDIMVQLIVLKSSNLEIQRNLSEAMCNVPRTNVALRSGSRCRQGNMLGK